MPHNVMPDKEWTLMFYFASDNPLTPSVVSQLKALKQAGYHPDVNVVAHFDPQNEATPTHVFDVNLINKLKHPGKSKIGFAGNDAYVRNLIEDKLWRGQKDRNEKDIREQLNFSLAKQRVTYDPPKPPPDRVLSAADAAAANGANGKRRSHQPELKEVGPKESLSSFLNFCHRRYPAKHYMLFILGHGMVVGDDIFLFDEHVDSDQQSLSLKDLGDVLKKFATNVRRQGAEFELVSFHSCSVSSLEVAHQLQYKDDNGEFKGVANYMLASQGSAFVGSWPYRQIVTRVLNDVKKHNRLKKEKKLKKGAEIDVKQMLVKIHQYILHNSVDFLLAGHSFQVTLCDLNKVSGVTATLKELSDELVKGLADTTVQNLILLAHWKSISFWQESYTDLYDYCFCLRDKCRKFGDSSGGMTGLVKTISTTCRDVLKLLAEGVDGDDDKLIVRTNFLGPTYQYSHGLSVFFPWAEPPRKFMSKYDKYEFRATSWNNFLMEYFRKTMRDTRKDEEMEYPTRRDLEARKPSAKKQAAANLDEDILNASFDNEVPMNSSKAAGEQLAGGKVDVRDPMGDECSCGSIKNYPRYTRQQRQPAKGDAKSERLLVPTGRGSFCLFKK